MGGFSNIGELAGYLKLDDSQFLEAIEQSAAASKIFAIDVQYIGDNLKRLDSELRSAGFSTKEFQGYLNSLRAQGVGTSDAVLMLGESIAVLQGRIATLHAQELQAVPRAAVSQAEQEAQLAITAEQQRIAALLQRAAVENKLDQDAKRRQSEMFARDNAEITEILRVEAATTAQRVGLEANAAARRIDILAAETKAAEVLYLEETAEFERQEAVRVKIESGASKMRTEVLAAEIARAEALFQEESAASGGSNAGGGAGRFGLRLGPGGIQPRGYLSGASAIGIGAGAFSVYELGKYTIEAAKASQETKNLSEEMGITWQQARRLEEGVKLSGSSLGSIQQAAGRLAESLDTGNAASVRIARTLEDMGVSGHTSGELILSLIDKLSQIPDQETRIAKTHEVLQRSAGLLLPYISNLDDINARLGTIANQTNPATQKSLLDLNSTLKDTGVEWDRLKEKMAVAAGAPMLRALLEAYKIAVATRLIIEEGVNSLGGLGTRDDYVSNTQAEQQEAQRRAKGFAAEQMATDAKTAAQRKAAHAETLEELREELSQEKANAREKNDLLNRTVMPLGPYTSPTRDQAEQEYQQSVDSIKRIQAAIDVETGKAERNSLAAKDRAYQIRQQEITNEENAAKAKLKINMLEENALDESDEQGIIKRRDRLIAYNNDVLALTVAANHKRLVEEKGRKEQKQDLTIEGNTAQATAQNTEANILLAQRASAEINAMIAEDAKRELRIRERQAEEDRRIGMQVANDKVRALQVELQAIYEHGVAVIELAKKRAQFEEQQGIITKAKLLSIERQAEDDEYKLQKEGIEGEIALLDTRKNRYGATDEAIQAKRAELVKQQGKLEDEHKAKKQSYDEAELLGLDSIGEAMVRLQVEQNKLNELQNASDRTIDLTNKKIQTEALAVATKGLGGVYEDLANTASQSFGQVGRTLATLFTDPSAFTKNWKSAIHSIEQELVGTLLQALLRLAAAKILLKIGLGAVDPATAATHASTIANTANTNATNVNTNEIELNTTAEDDNTEALRELTEALRSQQNGSGVGGFFQALVTGAIAPFLPGIQAVPKLADGGSVSKTGLAVVHAGEYMLSTAMLRGPSPAFASGFGGNISFDLRGSQFGSGVTQAMITGMLNKAVSALRRGGGLPTSRGRF